jgi:hypothetical protein
MDVARSQSEDGAINVHGTVAIGDPHGEDFVASR